MGPTWAAWLVPMRTANDSQPPLVRAKQVLGDWIGSRRVGLAQLLPRMADGQSDPRNNTEKTVT